MADLPLAWSKSSLGTLVDGCSWQYALEKVYGIPSHGSPQTAMGTAYHAAIEWYLRRLLLQQRDGIEDYFPFEDALAEGMRVLFEEVEDLPEEQWALHDLDLPALSGQLEAALTNWWETPIPEGQPGEGESLRERFERWRIVAIEPYFRTNVADGVTSTHGYIDVLAWDPDCGVWVVVDHKTASSYGRWPHDGGGHELEGSVYVVGAELADALPVFGPVRMEWHVVRKKLSQHARFEGVRCVEMYVTDIHRLWMEDTLKIADRIVTNDAFETNPGWNLCSPKWCPYFRGCQVDGDLHPSALAGTQQPAGV